MTLSRRSFLVGSGLAALATPRLISARGLLTDPTLDDTRTPALRTHELNLASISEAV